MKRYSTLFLLCVPMVLYVLPAGAEPRVIRLNDGSQIVGEVVSMANGVYTVHNEAIGMIRLPEDRVASIEVPGARAQAAAPAAPPNAQASSMLQSVQANIASNPGLVARIMQLQSDPQMQSILNDPVLMQAVQNLDFETLASSPKFQALMNNSTVKGVINESR